MDVPAPGADEELPEPGDDSTRASQRSRRRAKCWCAELVAIYSRKQKRGVGCLGWTSKPSKSPNVVSMFHAVTLFAVVGF